MMIPLPVILFFLAVLLLWLYFGVGHNDSADRRGGGGDPEASRLKAQEMKEAAIQAVIDAHFRGEIDVKTRNSQIAHLSRLPTNPQDGPGGPR